MIILLISDKCDQLRNVFFQFSKVHCNVAFVELCLLVVLHVLGNRQEETRLVKVRNHALDKVFDAGKFFFHNINLGFFILDLLFDFRNLRFHFSLHLLLLLLGERALALMRFDFLSNGLVLLFNHVNLRVEHVDVIEQRIILLFSFDESGDDFLN